MLYLLKNTSNIVPLTLLEATTISVPRYLVGFRNKETNVSSYCLLGTDSSFDIQRANRFTIVDKPTPNFLNAEVNLPYGDYYYTAYQLSVAQASGLGLPINPDLYPIVEGPCMCRVKEVESDFNTYYSGASTINTVYEG